MVGVRLVVERVDFEVARPSGYMAMAAVSDLFVSSLTLPLPVAADGLGPQCGHEEQNEYPRHRFGAIHRNLTADAQSH
jgi:hypothetical protein